MVRFTVVVQGFSICAAAPALLEVTGVQRLMMEWKVHRGIKATYAARTAS